MKEQCCRICFEKENLCSLYPKNMRDNLKQVFPYIYCNICHSLSIEKVPDDLSGFYENYYSLLPFTLERNKIKKKARKWLLSKKKWLSKLSCSFFNHPNDLGMKSLSLCGIDKSMKILDIGCGSGQLVYQLYELGIKEVIGIDAFLEKDLTLSNGAKIYKRDLFLEEGKWDIVMLHHVFEHMTNPYKILERLHTITAENGSLIIRVPNIDSYAFKHFQENWFGIQAPIHIFLPSVQGMKKMLDESGWKIINIFGENLLKLWEYNLAYSLGIGHQEEIGKKIFSDPRISKNLLFKKDYKYWKKINKKILSEPNLCDWIVYHIKRKDAS